MMSIFEFINETLFPGGKNLYITKWRFDMGRYFRVLVFFILCLSMISSVAACTNTRGEIEQINIEIVDKMPNMPPQFKMIDWSKRARDFDAYVFDFNIKGEFLPVIWWDKTRKNFDQDIIGLPAYIGDARQAGTDKHESITVLSALLGATLVGIDKSNQNGLNYIQMAKSYYNIDNGEGLILDTTDHDSGHSFWYELYPHILFYALAELYPNEPQLMEIVKKTADRWFEAVNIMCQGGKNINFNYNSFDFDTMTPNELGPSEPDGAAGLAWIQYAAYKAFKDEKFLKAADWTISFLENCENSPYYEILLPYGAYIAARMNAECNKSYDVEKLVKWCFNLDPMSARTISVTAGKWGDYYVDGLYVCWTDGHQYAFLMDTLSMAIPLVPLVRYDQRFAKSIGKWMLHAANNARLFYPDELPADNQSCPELEGNSKQVVAYEGLHSKWGAKEPYADGDARRLGWAGTDFGVYGSSHAGVFGGIISRTSDERILQLDCLKTDFFRDDAFPTYLYYNPYDKEKEIEINVGEGYKKIYDAISGKFIAYKVKGSAKVKIKGDSPLLLVIVPDGAKVEIEGGILKADGIVVDYNA